METNLETDANNIVIKPKKKYQPARFHSRQQIVDRIDKFAFKAKQQRKKQTECYAGASQLRRNVQPSTDEVQVNTLISKAKRKEAEGDRWGKKADRLEKDVLGALKLKTGGVRHHDLAGSNGRPERPGV